jgi:predicted membrane-bound spermidine synthase
MKISAYLAIFGIICLAFGLAFIVIPELTGSIYGVPAAPYTVVMSRYFGSAFLLIGLFYWLIRNLRDDNTKCAVLKANVVGGIAGGAVSLWVVLTGLENQMAWSTVLLYVLFTVGALYFLASPARRA